MSVSYRRCISDLRGIGSDQQNMYGGARISRTAVELQKIIEGFKHSSIQGSPQVKVKARSLSCLTSCLRTAVLLTTVNPYQHMKFSLPCVPTFPVASAGRKLLVKRTVRHQPLDFRRSESLCTTRQSRNPCPAIPFEWRSLLPWIFSPRKSSTSLHLTSERTTSLPSNKQLSPSFGNALAALRRPRDTLCNKNRWATRGSCIAMMGLCYSR